MAKNMLAQIMRENQELKAEIAHQKVIAADRILFAAQQAEDCAVLALGRTFGFGEERQKRFGEAYVKAFHEYCDNVLRDAKDDEELWYAKERIDRELKRYCGKYFQPWNERYGVGE